MPSLELRNYTDVAWSRCGRTASDNDDGVCLPDVVMPHEFIVVPVSDREHKKLGVKPFSYQIASCDRVEFNVYSSLARENSGNSTSTIKMSRGKMPVVQMALKLFTPLQKFEINQRQRLLSLEQKQN